MDKQIILNYSWVEKYRPKLLEECILPDQLRKELEQTIKDGVFTNCIFVGSPGIGKTTTAIAILKELDTDYIMINGGTDGNMDMLRTTITQFASTMSLKEGKKCIIIDEFDRVTKQVQESLNGFIEFFDSNVFFIFTCNFPGKILDALISRCPPINFNVANKDKQSIALQYLNRACFILEQEGIEYDKAAVAGLIKQYFPDFRRTINELQRYARNGSIDIGILAGQSNVEWQKLYKALKDKDFTTTRKWVAQHNDLDSSTFFRKLYDDLCPLITPPSIPELILLLAEYQYKASMVIDQEINNMACVISIMASVAWL